jgi:hypothetical protein
MTPRLGSLLLVLLALAPSAALAGDPPAKDEPVPALATDAEAEAALAAFEVAFRPKGLKGDERVAAQELAMRALAKVQHRTVVERFAKVLRSPSADLRTLAVMYMGTQRALPGFAGLKVADAMEQHGKDEVVLMTSIESLADLEYRGAVARFRSLLTHPDPFIVKTVLLTVGDTKEMRMAEDVLKMMKELKIDEGAKWEGGEVHYDTGAAGTHDQEMAEKIYQAKYGNNANAGKKAGRKMRDMGPILLETMKQLTGEQFSGAVQARAWFEKNKAKVDARVKELDAIEKAQREAAK